MIDLDEVYTIIFCACMIAVIGASRIIHMFICNYFEKIATKLEEKGVDRKVIEESFGIWLIPKCECKVYTVGGMLKWLWHIIEGD